MRGTKHWCKGSRRATLRELLALSSVSPWLSCYFHKHHDQSFFLIYKLRFVPRFSKFKRMRMGVFEQLLPKRWGPALILAAGCSDAERLSKLKSTKCPQSVHPKVNWSRFSLALVSRKIFVFMKLVLFFKSQIKANIMQQAQKLVQVDALKVLCNVL